MPGHLWKFDRTSAEVALCSTPWWLSLHGQPSQRLGNRWSMTYQRTRGRRTPIQHPQTGTAWSSSAPPSDVHSHWSSGRRPASPSKSKTSFCGGQSRQTAFAGGRQLGWSRLRRYASQWKLRISRNPPCPSALRRQGNYLLFIYTFSISKVRVAGRRQISIHGCCCRRNRLPWISGTRYEFLRLKQ